MHVDSKFIELVRKINFLLILLLAFSLPLAIKAIYLSYIIILLFITWLLQVNIKSDLGIINIATNKLLLLLPLYYILHIIALIYTTDINDGMKHLETKASMLLLPILFIGENSFTNKKSDGILKAFVAGNLVAVLVCIIIASLKSVSFNETGFNFNTSIWDGTRDYAFIELLKNNWTYFSYTSFSVFLHPSYFSMYLLFSVGVLVYFIHRNISRIWIFINILLILLFMFAIVLLGSRAGILSCAVAIIGYVFYRLYYSLRKIIYIPIILITFITVYLLVSSSRFSIIIREFSSFDLNGLKTTSNKRLKIWEKSIEQIQQNFFFGVGPGDSLKALNYVDEEGGTKININAHNQFLETFISLGLAGFSLLMAILIFPIVFALRKKNMLLLFFLFVLSFNFMFESVLERAAGTIFVVFFYCLFLKVKQNY
jgi:O-antigen ligase